MIKKMYCFELEGYTETFEFDKKVEFDIL